MIGHPITTFPVWPQAASFMLTCVRNSVSITSQDDADDADVVVDETPATKDGVWEKQQIKAFTAWVNSQLRSRELKIEDIKTDLSDGVMLIALMEIVGSTPEEELKLAKAAKGACVCVCVCVCSACARQRPCVRDNARVRVQTTLLRGINPRRWQCTSFISFILHTR